MSERYTTRQLRNRKVMNAKNPTKKLGKVHSFIFHPQQRKVLGFTVKRPDAALMFHRPEVFVALDGFTFNEEDRIVVSAAADATGKAACKRLGVNWEECLIWNGMPLLTEAGDSFGYVGDVLFEFPSGQVVSITAEKDMGTDAILGNREIPAELIRGFKFGEGEALGVPDAEGEDFLKGAIIVADAVAEIETEGGLAAKAGEASARAGAVAGEAVAKAKPVVEDAAAKAKEAAAPVAASAAAKAADVGAKAREAGGPALEKAKQAAETRLTDVRGMFANAAQEYRRGLASGEEEDE